MTCLLLALLATAAPADAPINPFAPPVIAVDLAQQWSFDKDAAGWAAQHQCRLEARAGALHVDSTGNDPYFQCAVRLPGGQMLLKMLARAKTEGKGGLFWTTDLSPRRGEDKARSFPLEHDGQWRQYEVRFTAPGTITNLRLDLGAAAGQFDIRWIRLARETLHPLTIPQVDTAGGRRRAPGANYGAAPRGIYTSGKRRRGGPTPAVWIDAPAAGDRPLEMLRLTVESAGLPPVVRTAYAYRPDAQTDWLVRKSADCTVRIARDGSVVQIDRAGKPAAAIAPLVQVDGAAPALRLEELPDGARLVGDGVSVTLTLSGKELAIGIRSRRPCEGPVVRALGALRQGLLAGVEYLGAGEKSSSRLDIETEEHLRFAPDPLQVTMPLMSFVTDRGAVAMTWRDMTLQPVFATPDFFDGADDHRMALRGAQIDAVLAIDDARLEETIAWCVRRQGLPALPQPPRTPEAQRALCLAAFNGPLKTAAGWGHCAEEHWTRQPFADIVSSIWRLTGEAPPVAKLVPGGGHVPDEASWFVTGRAAQWLDWQRARVEGLLKRQQADGSFRYSGPFARGHFEDTASGICALPATQMLEYARATGDKRALAAGLRTLDYMRRFDTPRGAQCWEIPLHTPDQLASAYAVWACVRGYELSGDKRHLAEARRWALSGVPFVYLWGRYPIMLYGTPPVLGATNWVAPNWIGLPVQWVGGVYAYALTLLAPHDQTLDWKQLARGILIAAQQMQFPDGQYVGLLPDSLTLSTQQRNPWRIQPGALLSLERALDGQVDALCLAVDGPHRALAPFPLTIRQGQAHIRSRPGVKYQVLIDGRRIVDVVGQGDDAVALDK